MTIRKESRGGEPRWVIDIPYRTAEGKRARFRRDAQVQTKLGAEGEHRRLLVELARSGTLARPTMCASSELTVASYTFAECVRHFRATHMQSMLKPSTRAGHEHWLEALLLPRFGHLPIAEVGGSAMAELDADLVAEGLAPSTRGNVHSAFRSVLRTAVRAGFVGSMPALPPLPKVGRKVAHPMRREDLDAMLSVASPSQRLAFELAALGGLRASEVRGLRWSDVEFSGGTITVRRALTLGIETTPKSHHHRVIPDGARSSEESGAGS